jgi:nucleoside-diphosphate-sugar epimerase
LVPQLIGAGYEVAAMTRDEGRAAWLGEVGAQPVVTDALDRTAVVEALIRTAPEVVIHQLTDLSGLKSFKNFDDEFALTNRLRTTGTDHLLEGARAAGVRRFVAQSYGTWNYERTGSRLKTETDPFDPNPPAEQTKSLAAIEYLEDAVANADGIEGVSLRYTNFYGPGTGFDINGDVVKMIRKRRFPKPRFEASREQRDRLAANFFAACEGHDIDGLVNLLAGDAAFYGDGGSKGTGVNRPIFGRDKIVKLLASWFRRGEKLGIRTVLTQVNGEPGAKFLDPEGRLINVMSLDIVDGAVQTVPSVVNPDKLAHLGPLSPIGRRSSAGDWSTEAAEEQV